MDWQISYEADEDIMLVRVTGTYDSTNTLPMIKALLDEAEIHGCLKFLIDSRLAIHLYRTVDYYHRPKVYSRLGINPAARAAVVFSSVGSQEKFFETVCTNRGFNLCVFSDIEAAKNWLSSDSAEGAVQPSK